MSKKINFTNNIGSARDVQQAETINNNYSSDISQNKEIIKHLQELSSLLSQSMENTNANVEHLINVLIEQSSKARENQDIPKISTNLSKLGEVITTTTALTTNAEAIFNLFQKVKVFFGL